MPKRKRSQTLNHDAHKAPKRHAFDSPRKSINKKRKRKSKDDDDIIRETNKRTHSTRSDYQSLSQPLPLSDTQLSTLYRECIRLNLTNRITQRNSWTLDLIDHMPDIIMRTHKNGENVQKSHRKTRSHRNRTSIHDDYTTKHYEKYLSKEYRTYNTNNTKNRSNHNTKNHTLRTTKRRNLSQYLLMPDDDSPDSLADCTDVYSVISEVISELQTLSSKKKDINFTTASATLSAAAKIYSCRVDAVHNETYRILGTLNSKTPMDKETNKNKLIKKMMSPREEWKKRYFETQRTRTNSLFDDDSLSSENIKFDLHTYVIKHRKICKTLSKKNTAKIRYKESDLLQRTDPLFHKMSTLFDTHGAKGLLLNHLKCSTDRPYLLLDADQVISKCLDVQSSQQCIHEKQSQCERADIYEKTQGLWIQQSFLDNIDPLVLYKEESYFHSNPMYYNRLSSSSTPQQSPWQYVSNRNHLISSQSIDDYMTPLRAQSHWSQNSNAVQYPTPPTVHRDMSIMETDSLGIRISPQQSHHHDMTAFSGLSGILDDAGDWNAQHSMNLNTEIDALAMDDMMSNTAVDMDMDHTTMLCNNDDMITPNIITDMVTPLAMDINDDACATTNTNMVNENCILTPDIIQNTEMETTPNILNNTNSCDVPHTPIMAANTNNCNAPNTPPSIITNATPHVDAIEPNTTPPNKKGIPDDVCTTAEVITNDVVTPIVTEPPNECTEDVLLTQRHSKEEMVIQPVVMEQVENARNETVVEDIAMEDEQMHDVIDIQPDMDNIDLSQVSVPWPEPPKSISSLHRLSLENDEDRNRRNNHNINTDAVSVNAVDVSNILLPQPSTPASVRRLPNSQRRRKKRKSPNKSPGKYRNGKWIDFMAIADKYMNMDESENDDAGDEEEESDDYCVKYNLLKNRHYGMVTDYHMNRSDISDKLHPTFFNKMFFNPNKQLIRDCNQRPKIVDTMYELGGHPINALLIKNNDILSDNEWNCVQRETVYNAQYCEVEDEYDDEMNPLDDMNNHNHNIESVIHDTNIVHDDDNTTMDLNATNVSLPTVADDINDNMDLNVISENDIQVDNEIHIVDDPHTEDPHEIHIVIMEILNHMIANAIYAANDLTVDINHNGNVMLDDMSLDIENDMDLDMMIHAMDDPINDTQNIENISDAMLHDADTLNLDLQEDRSLSLQVPSPPPMVDIDNILNSDHEMNGDEFEYRSREMLSYHSQPSLANLYLSPPHHGLNKRLKSIVNIKHLKESMKEILLQSSHSNRNQRDDRAKKGTISFQTLCNTLKQSEVLKSNTKDLLTIPNCFMSLMHLSTQIGLDLSRIPIQEPLQQHETESHTNDGEYEMNDKHQLGDFIVFTNV
eukprot:15000_1